MDVKIGFSDTPRELVVSAAGDQQDVATKVREAVQNGSGVLELADDKGNSFVIRTECIIYAEIGPESPRTVGFAGA